MLSRFARFAGVKIPTGRYWMLAAVLALLAVVPVSQAAPPKPPTAPKYNLLRVPLSSANLPPIVITNPNGSQSMFPLVISHNVSSHRLNDRGDLLFHATATLAPGTPPVVRSFVYLRAENVVVPLSEFSTVQFSVAQYVGFTSDRKVIVRNHATATLPQEVVQVYSINVAFDGAGDPIQKERRRAGNGSSTFRYSRITGVTWQSTCCLRMKRQALVANRCSWFVRKLAARRYKISP
jgi:hypothetical protein